MESIDSTVGTPKRVAFLSENAEMVESVSERLAGKGVEVLGFSGVEALIAGMGPAAGAILVLDTKALQQDQDVAGLLARIDRLCGDRPLLVCVAHSRDVGLRLQALRAGAEAYFVGPVAVDDLAARLLELSGVSGSDGYRVLVVDDQPTAALFAARVLERAGMQTCFVGDALRVLDVLEAFCPDLVLMDLHMPGADGIELTTLIREHNEFFDTPVIFLSSELDLGKQIEALRVGGTDFIAKPVHPKRLVQAVRRGIASSRSMREHKRPGKMDRDRITGLMSRSTFLGRLDASIGRGRDQGSGDGVLMIQIQLPSADGGAADRDRIDAFMERLAGPLRARLKGLECATRYGDSRFAILAKRQSEAALSELAETLAAELTSVVEPDAVHLIVGIGLFDPRADDAPTMISRAEKACSQASDSTGTKGSRIGVFRPDRPESPVQDAYAPLAGEVEEALRSQAFHLLYQPIVALRRTKGERYGTILSLKTSDGEFIQAFDFLSVAQCRGLMPVIDRWVMANALDRLQQQRDARPGLRFFVHQTMETLLADDWLPWFRRQIIERDLIRQRPILQLQLKDVSANRKLASVRFAELRRLAIEICLNLLEEDPGVLGLIEDLAISLVRIPLPISASPDATRLRDFVALVHDAGAKVIVARIEDPQTIARVFTCGADFIQGNFLQLPSEELNFDFSESALA